jgi:hypothetical protein
MLPPPPDATLDNIAGDIGLDDVSDRLNQRKDALDAGHGVRLDGLDDVNRFGVKIRWENRFDFGRTGGLGRGASVADDVKTCSSDKLADDALHPGCFS